MGESEIKTVNPIEEGRVSKIKIVHKKNLSLPLIFEPDLFFIAEGAQSATAEEFGMVDDSKDVVENACTGENWVFGNFDYQGNKTLVVSMAITSKKVEQIANVIFNAKSQVINVAVTAEKTIRKEEIKRLLEDTLEKALECKKTTVDREKSDNEVPQILNAVKEPVSVTNRIASICSRGNVFQIGDAAGCSSPLAGLGGTLGLTLVPCTVEKLLEDYEKGSHELHSNFKTFSHAYVNRWIDKSLYTKALIQGIFEKERSLENVEVGNAT